MIRIVSQGTALITGAASGIGAIYAHRLALRGYDLLLVDSRPLEGLAEWLRQDTRAGVEILAADVSTEAGLSAVEDRVILENRLTMLVNNASAGAAALGFARRGNDADLVAYNLEVPARLAYAAAGGFVERGGGTIVNVAPVAASTRATLPGLEDGGRALLLELNRVLQEDLGDQGLRTQLVLPGAAASAFWDLAGDQPETLAQEVLLLAEGMVDQALAALDAGFVIARPSVPRIRDWDRFEEQAARSPFARLTRGRLVELA
jgi:short-subunit dehydrogenase